MYTHRCPKEETFCIKDGTLYYILFVLTRVWVTFTRYVSRVNGDKHSIKLIYMIVFLVS